MSAFRKQAMRKIYEHIDHSRVGLYQSILESAGIRTHLKNVGASIGMGEIPFTQLFPELWVVEDSDYDHAIAILKPYHEHGFPVDSDWQCPGCGEGVDGAFGECWNCQAPRPVPGGAETQEAGET
jgi:hypothetical protein